uniref:Calponin-homology (CH) domain-containing protein n=1 Tax=Glossina palpalis gambiensis TaxID=67801 RepID=A0A1B0B1H6_9MUSC
MLGGCVSSSDTYDNIADYIKIYTDWANYYLERAKSKKKVTDLSSDCRDGLLLAEIIEAVTSFKVPDLHKKPKNQQQMIYTDWANYYLERAKSKKKVTDLSSDCRDGLLLAEIIEAVTSFKVPDLHKKPKNQQQMVSFGH